MFGSTPGGVVPALDTPSFAEAVDLVRQVDDVDGVVGYKLGLVASLDRGLAAAVRELRAVTAKPLIYDHQKAGPDVAGMGERFAAICAEAGVEAAILFPLGGPGVVEAFVTHCQQRGVRPVVGGALPERDSLVSGGGFIADDALPRICRQAASLGVTDFVSPANDLARLRDVASILREEVAAPSLFLPGVDALEGQRSAAVRAVAGCRPLLIVGRGIHRASEPRKAAAAYADALGEGLTGTAAGPEGSA